MLTPKRRLELQTLLGSFMRKSPAINKFEDPRSNIFKTIFQSVIFKGPLLHKGTNSDKKKQYFFFLEESNLKLQDSSFSRSKVTEGT